MQLEPLTGDIVLNENPALRAEKAVEDGARRMKATVENANAQAAKNVESQWKETMGNLNSQFGKRSLLGQSLKLAAGGGAVGGLSMLGRELASGTKEMAGLVAAMRNGEVSTGEFGERMAGSIPVLGQFWQAGRNIREMLTGEEAAQNRLNATMEQSIAVNEKAILNAKKYRHELEGLESLRQGAQDKITLHNSPDQAGALALRNEEERVRKATRPQALKVSEDVDAFKKQMEKDQAALDQWQAKAALAKKNFDDHPAPGYGNAILEGLGNEQAHEAAVAAFKAANELANANLALSKARAKLLDDKGLLKEAEAYKKAMEKVRDALIIDGLPVFMPSGPNPDEKVKQSKDVAFGDFSGFHRDFTPRMMQQLPSPITQAEELFGPKSVAGTGPAGFIDATEGNTKSTDKNTEVQDRNTEALEKLMKSYQQGPTTSGATINWMTGF